MSYENLIADLHVAMQNEDADALQALLDELKPADFADYLQMQAPEDALESLALLPARHGALVLGHLSITQQLSIAALMPDDDLAALLDNMDADERADLFNLLPAPRREPVMGFMTYQSREELIHLSSYPEGTAGAVMTSGYVTIPSRVAASDALAILRYTAPRAETIYQLYVIDGVGKLVGVVSLRDIILARPNTRIHDLISTEIISAPTDMSQEEVAKLISRYDLLALPVLDERERLVGIVTYDDAMDVAEAEATEDIHKSATVGKLETGVGESGLFMLYRKRIGWLVLLVFVNIFSGAGIAHFEETISAYIALLFFLPLLIASGGNAGAQAATLMVRGLATGDVGGRDWGRLLGRELLVATGLGLSMALAVSVIGVLRTEVDVVKVVAFSMVAIVIIGSLVGMILPFILHRLGWDPATASAPLVTSIADGVGVIIYFSIATLVLFP
ncbi:magnesium transporter [Marinimicrobium alkaliphilum]|uniref:magnesium transporter n=1 Tax=Marinimicrobium alkaliphilum TaxID=2202654 RepID=UPI000DBA776F|nr:magnesium transporter [Marinimicrobium alkaliphilum]